MFKTTRYMLETTRGSCGTTGRDHPPIPVGFAQIGPLSVAATVITDAGAADAERAWLTEAGLDVVIA